MLNIILFGPPGSGKGTQSDLIIEKFGLTHISTGNILREEVKNETELGLLAKDIMSRGELVSDEIMIGMIKNKLQELGDVKGVIFDGFPRTKPQAEALDNLLKEYNTEISVLISLEVPEDELMIRLLNRAKLEGRSDDNEDTIKNRIQEYKNKTAAVADYYEEKGKLKTIHGVGSIDEIFTQISEILS